MTRTVTALLVGAPVLLMAALHSGAAHLDHATRRQCVAQDWPVHQHSAHLAVCRAYLAAP